MKIMTLTSYSTQFSLHSTDTKLEWRLDKTPDNLAQVNRDILDMLNRSYLPNCAVYEITPYTTLIETIKQELMFLDPKLELLVPEIEHGKGVPKDAII